MGIGVGHDIERNLARQALHARHPSRAAIRLDPLQGEREDAGVLAPEAQHVGIGQHQTLLGGAHLFAASAAGMPIAAITVTWRRTKSATRPYNR